MRTDDLVGAVWLPGDGKANPTDLTQSLAKGARNLGVKIFERTYGEAWPPHVRACDRAPARMTAPCPPARASVRMRSPPSSAKAEWARCTARPTRS